MPSSLTIRRATASDGEAVAELLTQLGYPSEPEPAARRLARLAVSPHDVVLVAVEAEVAVGVIKLHIMPVLHEDADLGRLTALVIHQDRRGQGIGRRLVQAAEEIARAQGCARVEVTSAEPRQDAHAFYRHLGYQQNARRFIKHI